MELFLFRPQVWERKYNCARINPEEVPLVERQNPLNGTLVILLFILFQVLYIPCLFTIRKHLSNSAYKILFFIGIIDVIQLNFQGLISGIYNFMGEIFCAHPKLNYVLGTVRGALFVAETSADFILALDRLAEIAAPNFAAIIFEGNKTWIWLVIPQFLGIYWFFFVGPAVFSSVKLNWVFNPFEGYNITVDINEYASIVSFYYNLFLSFGFPIIYSIFIAFFVWELKNTKLAIGIPQQSNFQKIIFLQAALICGVNVGSTTIHALIGRLPVSKLFIIIAFYSNYLIYGLPPIIYLLVNKNIRADCRKMIGKGLIKLGGQLYRPSPTVHSQSMAASQAFKAINPNHLPRMQKTFQMANRETLRRF